jgi:hypothetical protein
MHTHANARLTQLDQLRLVSQHLNHHRPIAELTAEAGISLRCAYKWLVRYRSGRAITLADRRNVRCTQRWALDPQKLQCAENLRHQQLLHRKNGRLLTAAFSTVPRALNRLGLGRLRNLAPKHPDQRYKRKHTEDLIHIDDNKLARYPKAGHRITRTRRQGRAEERDETQSPRPVRPSAVIDIDGTVFQPGGEWMSAIGKLPANPGEVLHEQQTPSSACSWEWLATASTPAGSGTRRRESGRPRTLGSPGLIRLPANQPRTAGGRPTHWSTSRRPPEAPSRPTGQGSTVHQALQQSRGRCWRGREPVPADRHPTAPQTVLG